MKLDQFLKWQGWASTGGEATAVAYNFYDSINATNSQGFSLDAIGDEDGGTAFAAGPLDFAADDTIDVHVQVAPGTSVAGTITMYAYIS